MDNVAFFIASGALALLSIVLILWLAELQGRYSKLQHMLEVERSLHVENLSSLMRRVGALSEGMSAHHQRRLREILHGEEDSS